MQCAKILSIPKVIASAFLAKKILLLTVLSYSGVEVVWTTIVEISARKACVDGHLFQHEVSWSVVVGVVLLLDSAVGISCYQLILANALSLLFQKSHLRDASS